MRNDFQIFLKQIPALRILVGIIIGIVVQEYFSFSAKEILFVFSILLLLFIGYNFVSIKKKFAYRWLSGIVVLSLFCCAGALLHLFNKDTFQDNWYGHFDNSNAYEIVLQQVLEEKPKTFKTIGKVTHVLSNNNWQPTQGDVLLYFRKDSIPDLTIGSVILTNKPLQLIKNSGNPGEFNYQQYSNRNNHYHQLFLNRKEYILSDKKVHYPFKEWLADMRTTVMQTIDKFIKGDDERAVAKALLIGYRKDIDRDLYQRFTNTGVVHIIAISGMHLAMIYAALLLLLKPVKRRKNGKFIAGFITPLIIWIFTLLAGFVSSIARAAVMFSFIIIGEMLSRKTNIYNSLAVSALVLLLINTYTLWDVGFLLSYSAVLSIVVFHKPIHQLLFIENKLLQMLWNVISVTLSAQILTLPFILYYFHQFPALFIISNLIAIPLSGLILYMEAFLILLSPIPFLAKPVGYITEELISWFNNIIVYIDQIPFVLVRNIHFSGLQTFLLFIFIALLYIILVKKKYKLLFHGIVMFIAIIAIGFIEKNKHKNQQKIIVYNTSQNLVINFIEGYRSFILSKEDIAKGSTTDIYVIQPSHHYFHTKEKDNLADISTNFPYLSYKGYKIFVLRDNKTLPQNANPDINLVIADDYNDELETARNIFPNAAFVFANTNRFWKTEQWKKQCNALNLRCHATSVDGAFVVDVQ